MATHLYLIDNNEQSKNNLFCLFRNLCRSWWEQMSTICHLQLWSMGCSMNSNNNSINRSNSSINHNSREYRHPTGLWPSPTTRCQAWRTQWTPSSTTLPSLSTPRFSSQIFIHCVWTAEIWMSDDQKCSLGECWGYSQSAGRDAVQWSERVCQY